MASPSLESVLLAPGRRPRVVSDLVRLVSDEVASKTGPSGLAMKGGYAAVRRIRKGFVPNAINRMLPNFTRRLDRYYAEYDPARDGSLSDFLVANSSAVADLLLGVADSGARRTKADAARKVYQRLRPQAKKHVEQALPRLGVVLQGHLSEAGPVDPGLPLADGDRTAGLG